MSKRLIDSKLGDFKRIVVTFIMIFIMSIFIGSFIYVDNSLRPTITVLAETKAIELANRSINKAVGEIVKDKIDYSDLIYTKLDSKGKISMIQSNTILMNQIASDVALEIQNELKQVKSTTAYIPIIEDTSKFEPDCKIYLSNGVNAYQFFKKIIDKIMNNKDSLYLEAKTQVKVVIPLTTSTKEVKAQIPICETIIVGEVPESYINVPAEIAPNMLPK